MSFNIRNPYNIQTEDIIKAIINGHTPRYSTPCDDCNLWGKDISSWRCDPKCWLETVASGTRREPNYEMHERFYDGP